MSRTLVEKFLAGSATQAQLARRYDLSPHLIIQWRNNYASGKLADLERRLESHDEAIQSLVEAIRQLMVPPEPERSRIGFIREDQQ
ncbi:MAG: transposase [Dehalococcoidia bacterium]|nr:transposase [Dehalococcoidia bacterium]